MKPSFIRRSCAAISNRTALASSAASLACALILGAATPSSAAPLLQFAASADLTVGQLAAGSEAVIFGVCKHPHDWTSRLAFHLAAEVDQDGDGEVVYEAGAPLASRAVWVAAELASGALDVAGPTLEPPLAAAVDSTEMLAKAGFIEDRRQGLRVLVLRPGVGAWHGSASDGGAGDSGPADDGRVLVPLATLTPVTTATADGAPSLTTLAAGDVIVGIDTTTLATYHFTVPALSR